MSSDFAISCMQFCCAMLRHVRVTPSICTFTRIERLRVSFKELNLLLAIASQFLPALLAHFQLILLHGWKMASPTQRARSGAKGVLPWTF
jgi:hypothetical protein